MKTVAVISRKGGVGKTTISHLLAVGAIWNDTPAYLLHTDDREPIDRCERPYGYFDCRTVPALSRQAETLLNSGKRGLIVIDSGGNRPKHDTWIASNVDLVIIPMLLSAEDIRVANEHAGELAKTGADVRFVINRMPAKSRLSAYDHDLLDRMTSRQLLSQVGEVRASRVLLDSDPEGGFGTPPTAVNNAARGIYRDLLNVVKT